MSFYGNPSTAYSGARNLLTKEGAICFGTDVTTEPSGTTDPGKFVLYRYGTELKLWDGTTTFTISGSGGTLNAVSLASAPSNPTVGEIYYDTTLDKLRGYQDAGWTNFDGTAAGSLDAAYNGGATITVDGGAVTLTDSQTGTGGGLLITKSGVVTGSSSASIFHINSTGAHDTSGNLKCFEISVGTETISGSVYGIEVTMNARADSACTLTKGGLTVTDGDVTLSAVGNSTASGFTATTANTSGDGFTFNIDSLTSGDGFIIDGDATGGAVNYFCVQEGSTNIFTITDDDVYSTKPVEIDVDDADAFLVTQADNTEVLSVDTTQDAADDTLTLTGATTSGTTMKITGVNDTGAVVEINADSVSTGDALRISVASGTMTSAGAAISVIDSSNSDREVFAVRDDGKVYVYGQAEGTTAMNLVTGDFVVTDGDITVSGGEMALTGDGNEAIFVGVGNSVTTANGFELSSTSITTGALMKLNANTTAHDGEVLEIISAGDATSTPKGISITMSAVATGAGVGLWVDVPEGTTNAKGISVRMDKITTGDMLYLDNGGGTMTEGSGCFINCNDDDTSQFQVGRYGETTIAGKAAGTAALTLDLGDLVLTDTDSTTFTSVNGTGNIVEIIATDCDIGAGKAMLELDGAGEWNATGTGLLISIDGITATNNPYAMRINAAGKDAGAIYIDSDAATDSVVHIHSGGATADNQALLELTIDGTPAAAGSNMLRVDGSGGTNTAKNTLVEIYDDSVSVGLSVSTASVEDMVVLTGTGATGAGRAVLAVTSTGTIADGAFYVDITSGANGASSTASYLLHVDAAHTNIEGIHVDAGKSLFDELVTFGGGMTQTAVSRTPTADGTGTGTIAAGTSMVDVTGGTNVNCWLTLPTPVVGHVIWLVGTSGTNFEVRTNQPATVAINGGTDTNGESDVAAGVTCRLVCTSATTWIGTQFSAAGTESPMTVAAD